MGQFSDLLSVYGISSVEGYHAGAVRQLLIGMAYDTVVGTDGIVLKDLAAVRRRLQIGLWMPC